MMRVFLTILILLFLPNISLADVIISEVFYDSIDTPEHNYEFVELYNDGSLIDISGWVLQDDSKEYVILDGTVIEAGAYFIINRALVNNSFSLKNTGETLVLKNGSNIQDTKVYKDDAEEGQSLQKQLDGTWVAGTPTQGSGPLMPSAGSTTEQNSEQSSSNTTVINEVTTYNTVTIEPPQDIYVREMPSINVLLGSSLSVRPEVYDATGSITNASCRITFGDGSESKSCDASLLYQYAGEYVVHISVLKDSLHDETTMIVKVLEPELVISVDGDNKYIELSNKLSTQVGLSGWRLQVGYKTFIIPNNTIIPAQSSIKISAKTIKIDIARYGGVAKLFNVFNKIVADSSTQPIEQTKIIEEVVEIVMGDTIVQTLVNTPMVIEGAPQTVSGSDSSVIGMRVQNMAIDTADTASHAQVIVEEVAQVPSLEPIATATIVSPWSRLMPRESGRWLVGLLALVGLASIPVLLGKKDDIDEAESHTKSSKDDKRDGFTIEEVR